MKRLLALGMLLLCWVARGATYTAASASYVDVAQAITNAAVVDGDTINIPAGTPTWSSTLTITKAINLIGAGTNAGGTIIGNSVGNVFYFRPANNKPLRLSGVRINSSDASYQTVVRVDGPATMARIDHCLFSKADMVVEFNYDRNATGPAYGVVDHCSFYNCSRAFFVCDSDAGDNGTVNGFTRTDGSISWTRPILPGTTNQVVVENCLFEANSGFTSPINDPTIIYGQGGGRICLRYNVFQGTDAYIDAHGDGNPVPPTGTYLSVVFYEVYSNVFNLGPYADQTGDSFANIRGGMALYHDNVFIDPSSRYSHLINAIRYFNNDIHIVTNFFWWNNAWVQSGVTNVNQNGMIYVKDVTDSYSTSAIHQNQQYWLAPPAAGQAFYPYTARIDGGWKDLPYPHPLVSPSAPSTNPVTSISPSTLTWTMNPSSGTSNKTFTVQNTGQGTLTGSVAFASAGSAFAFSGGTTYSLTSNQSSTITVAYTAPAGVTTVSSNAVIFTDNGGGATGIVQGNAPRTYVWALGDSLTQGHDINGGYRLPLYNLLTNNGVNAWFVGNANDNSTNLTPACVWHDGYGGYEITNGVNSGLAENVSGWFGNLGATPNYILLMIGFNDYRLNDRTATATNRLESLIVRLATLAPSATIFVADLNPWVNLATTNNTMETYYNPYIPSIVSRQLGLGRNVKLVDMRGKLAPTDLESDNTHPTQTGYNIIATNWFAVIQGSPTPPYVITQPIGVTNFYGSTLNLSVVASGSPTLSYQWRLNTNAIGGASSATYIKSNVSTNDQGWYDVLIANSYGSTSSIPVYVSLSANPNVPPGLVSSGSTGAAASWNSLVLGPVTSSGANRLLLYYGYSYDAAGELVTNVTFNTSEQFTRLARTNYYDSFGVIDLWYLVNPSLNTANVLVNGNSLDEVAGRVMLVTNVNQSSPFEAVSMSFVQNGSPVTSDSLIPAQTTNELVIDALVSSSALWSPSATLIGNIAAPNGTFFCDSQAPGTSPATGMTWSGGSDMISHIAVAIKPATGAAPIPPGQKVAIHGKMSIRGKGSIK